MTDKRKQLHNKQAFLLQHLLRAVEKKSLNRKHFY